MLRVIQNWNCHPQFQIFFLIKLTSLFLAIVFVMNTCTNLLVTDLNFFCLWFRVACLSFIRRIHLLKNVWKTLPRWSLRKPCFWPTSTTPTFVDPLPVCAPVLTLTSGFVDFFNPFLAILKLAWNFQLCKFQHLPFSEVRSDFSSPAQQKKLPRHTLLMNAEVAPHRGGAD